jgi:hypothetical protein
MSTFPMRWVYCTDSGEKYNMATPGGAVHSVLEEPARIVGDRETGMGWNAAVVEVGEQLVGDVGVQCSRVVVVVEGGGVGALVGGGDYAASGISVSEGSSK